MCLRVGVYVHVCDWVCERDYACEYYACTSLYSKLPAEYMMRIVTPDTTHSTPRYVSSPRMSRSHALGTPETTQDCHRQPALACWGVVPRTAMTTWHVSGESGRLPQAIRYRYKGESFNWSCSISTKTMGRLTHPARYRLVINIIRFLLLFTATEFVLHHLFLRRKPCVFYKINIRRYFVWL